MHYTHIFEGVTMTNKISFTGRVVDLSACDDAKDVSGLLQLYLSLTPEDRGLVQLQHANLLLDAKRMGA